MTHITINSKRYNLLSFLKASKIPRDLHNNMNNQSGKGNKNESFEYQAFALAQCSEIEQP